MKELLIIDGYNYLFNIFDNRKLSKNELEEIREKFVDELVEYKNITGFDVIVVFDSYKFPGSVRNSKEYKGIEIIFSGVKTTADHIIEEISYSRKGYDKKFIITSDNTAQTVVFKENIYRKSSREFYIELKKIKNDLKNKMRKMNIGNRKSSFSTIEKRLNKEQFERVSKLKNKHKS